MSKLVSIIVPIYNVEKYLQNALLSVQKQDYSMFEVILVDDGSTDNSSKLARSFSLHDARFKYFRTENQGQACARNLGLRLAQGDYIAFLDPDDSFQSNFLSTCIFNFDSGCDMISTLFPGIENKEKEGKNLIEEVSQNEFIEKMYSGQIGNVVWNKMFTAKILTGVKFPEGQIHEEIDFFNQFIFTIKKAKVINRVLYNYRQHRIGNSSEHFSKEEIRVIEQLDCLIKNCDYKNFIEAKTIVVVYTLVFLKDYIEKLNYRDLLGYRSKALFFFDVTFKSYVNFKFFFKYPKVFFILSIWRIKTLLRRKE